MSDRQIWVNGMAKLFVTLTVTTVLVAANAFSFAETRNAPEAFKSIGKTDRLEISISPRPGDVVLEQREIGLSKLYLTAAGEAGCNAANAPRPGEAIGS
jgi:hypothetical protein